MASGRMWTKEDKEYLDEKWGINSIPYLAKKLNRTWIAVNLKAKRMGLGPSTRADEYITANQVALLLKVDRHAVTRWIIDHDLKATKRVTLFKKKCWMIRHCNLCKWSKNNQDKFDSRRIEIFALGYEPLWLQEKRKRDRELPKNSFKKWTAFDVQKIIIYSKDMTYKRIAEIMGRSYDSIERKMGRLSYQSNLLEKGVEV